MASNSKPSPFNLFIMPEDVMSWAATPTRLQLRVTCKQASALIDKIAAKSYTASQPVCSPAKQPFNEALEARFCNSSRYSDWYPIVTTMYGVALMQEGNSNAIKVKIL